MDINKSLFQQAQRSIPGGVNSPVRSFKAVGGCPVFFKKGHGSKLYSEEGGEYIDFCQSWGAMMLGHAHPEVVEAITCAARNGTSYGAATRAEIELAETICDAVPSIDMVRMTTSGTEAVMGAIRLARAYTGKNTIIKCAGSYHGHADYLLAQAGSGAMTLGIPTTPGVPASFTQHTVIVPYNDCDAIRQAVDKHKDTLAAIIIEPVAANCGVIIPDQTWLSTLRTLCTAHGAVLIFDEVITGFRLAYGGAQERFNVTPDLTCLGKIIGGGMPVGAFGGRRDIMSLLAPAGQVYQAGTLSGNPVAVAAGLKTIQIIRSTDPYAQVEAHTAALCDFIRTTAQQYDIAVQVNTIGSLFSVFFTETPVIRFTDSMQNTHRYASYFHTMLTQGIYLSPSAFEAQFAGAAHSDTDWAATRTGLERSFNYLATEISDEHTHLP